MNQLPLLLPVYLQHHQNLLHPPDLLLPLPLLVMPQRLPLCSACTAGLPPAICLL
jgi:hypothetical protein